MLALFAVFAFSAIASASASALEWLVKGLAFTGALEVETTGSLLLIHLAGGFLEPEAIIECTGTFDGTVEGGASGFGTVTALLDSKKLAVSLTNKLSCTSIKTCEKTTDIFVAPQNMPWLTTLEAMAGPLNLVLFSSAGSGNPAYEIECLVLGGLHETLCEGETSAWLEAMVGPELLGTFVASELEAEGLEGLCEEGSTSHLNVALQEGNGVIKLVSGEELTVG